MFLPESYKKLKRGPQVILPKDIGIIIGYTGVGKTSSCLDAGTGSGWLAVCLARICKRVVTYDIRDDFIKIAEKNKVLENLDNLEITKKDITKGTKERNMDLVTLDMPNSDKAIATAHRALKNDGYICGYLPHVEQVKKFVKTLEKSKFRNIQTIEAIVRDMLVRKEGVRPSTKGIWHTAYLVFAQK
jgi:tRNA (adenine57-N1/adenine58-N1)-methyltransferase catalytic subunit